MAGKRPSAWAMDMFRHYAACSSAVRRVGVEELAFILDAAREQGRRERDAEIAAWLRGIAHGPAAVVWNGAADEIERGAGRKENDHG